MKAEERKELKTNALAYALTHVTDLFHKGPSRNTLTIGAGILVAVAVIALGWYFFDKHAAQERSKTWTQVEESDGNLPYAASMDDVDAVLEKLAKDAKEHAGSNAGRTLNFKRARLLYAIGFERFGSDTDHAKAVKQIEEARDLYAKLAPESDDTPILQQEALLGVARARETLGDLDQALSDYKKVATKFPNTTYGKMAKDRADYLDKEENRKKIKDLLAVLNEQNRP
jgi:tetratricopeptide (TPR) repeat protein